MDWSDFFLVLLGGLLVLIPDYFRHRREEKRWKEESTINYFRGFYDRLIPFLIIIDRINIYFMKLSLIENLKEQKEILNNLQKTFEAFIQAYNDFLGFELLFPKDLRGKLFECSILIARQNKEFNEGTIDPNHQKDLVEKANQIIERIRQLLNVDALD